MILVSVPFPVADFFQVLAVFRNVLLVFYQFVVHLLNEEGTFVAKLGQVHDGVFYQVEPVNLVLDTHVKGSGNRTFFQVSVNGHVVVIPLEGQLVNQGRIAVEGKNYRFVFCKDCVVFCVA